VAGITFTAYDLATRFVGVKEFPGSDSNPFIMSLLRLDQGWPRNDEVPWCSAFVNYIAWLIPPGGLPRSKNLAARSWLDVGRPINLDQARAGFDVVILSRGADPASGHVGFYAHHTTARVTLLGGNQSDAVRLSDYDVRRVVGVRRLWDG